MGSRHDEDIPFHGLVTSVIPRPVYDRRGAYGLRDRDPLFLDGVYRITDHGGIMIIVERSAEILELLEMGFDVISTGTTPAGNAFFVLCIPVILQPEEIDSLLGERWIRGMGFTCICEDRGRIQRLNSIHYYVERNPNAN